MQQGMPCVSCTYMRAYTLQRRSVLQIPKRINGEQSGLCLAPEMVPEDITILRNMLDVPKKHDWVLRDLEIVELPEGKEGCLVLNLSKMPQGFETIPTFIPEQSSLHEYCVGFGPFYQPGVFTPLSDLSLSRDLVFGQSLFFPYGNKEAGYPDGLYLCDFVATIRCKDASNRLLDWVRAPKRDANEVAGTPSTDDVVSKAPRGKGCLKGCLEW